MTTEQAPASPSADSAEPAALDAQALWFSAPRTPELRSESVPPPGPGEIRVRALASGIGRGTVPSGHPGEGSESLGESLQVDLRERTGEGAFPRKQGYASVGRVESVGPGVQGFAPGDLVFVEHPHQSVYVVPGEQVVRLPRGLPPELGIFLTGLESAINVLLDTPLHLGETAVVFGQGTVGLLITQLLKRAGAGRVLVVEPLEARRQAALGVGADGALAPEDAVEERVRALTGGRGADVVVEVSGTAAGLQAAIDAVADEGTVVAVSWYGTTPVTLDLGGHFHRGRVRIRSSQVGRLSPELALRWDRARRMALARDLLAHLQLADLITHRLPFARAPEAYRLLTEHPGEALQVVLTYEE